MADPNNGRMLRKWVKFRPDWSDDWGGAVGDAIASSRMRVGTGVNPDRCRSLDLTWRQHIGHPSTSSE